MSFLAGTRVAGGGPDQLPEELAEWPERGMLEVPGSLLGALANSSHRVLPRRQVGVRKRLVFLSRVGVVSPATSVTQAIQILINTRSRGAVLDGSPAERFQRAGILPVRHDEDPNAGYGRDELGVGVRSRESGRRQCVANASQGVGRVFVSIAHYTQSPHPRFPNLIGESAQLPPELIPAADAHHLMFRTGRGDPVVQQRAQDRYFVLSLDEKQTGRPDREVSLVAPRLSAVQG